MAKVIIYPRDHEFTALTGPAQREYRAPGAQAALIMRRGPEKPGLIPGEISVPSNQTDLPSEIPDEPVAEGG